MKSKAKSERKKSEDGSWLELRVFAGLELFGEFQFAFSVFGAAEIAIGLAEQMVGNIVVGVHGDGALESADGELGFSLFLQDFAEKNVRASGGGVQPNGTLEEFFGLVEFLDAGVGVGEFVVSGGIAGVDGQFLLELRDSFGNFGLVEIEFAEKLMGERKFWIELYGFFAV